MSSNSEVQNRLASAVVKFSRSRGIALDASAQDYVGTLIAEAAERMERDGALDESGRVAEAEAAFERLIVASARRGGGIERRGGYEPPVPPLIREARMQDALLDICPLWPIC